MKPADALRELRALVATYLEDSDDSPRAAELLAALDPDAPIAIPAEAPLTEAQKDRQRRMFGLTTDQVDEVLTGKSPRDVAIYAMGTLSNAQELIQQHVNEDDNAVTYLVNNSTNANSIRQLMNVAKYAIDKAVPR